MGYKIKTISVIVWQEDNKGKQVEKLDEEVNAFLKEHAGRVEYQHIQFNQANSSMSAIRMAYSIPYSTDD